MTNALATERMLRMIERAALDLEAAQPYLTELDAAMGDGDHGVSMTIGCRAVRKTLPAQAEKTVADLLQHVGTTFQAAAGATVGALLGAALASAAAALKGKDELAAEDLAQAFRAATDAVMRLGGAQPGDKTLVDALYPATAALEAEIAQGSDAFDAFECALQAAKEGMEATRSLVARKGRASRLGERTRGHIDPGATSCFLILQSCYRFLQHERGTPATPTSQRAPSRQS